MHPDPTVASLFSGIAGLDRGPPRRMRCTLMVGIEQHTRTATLAGEVLVSAAQADKLLPRLLSRPDKTDPELIELVRQLAT